MLGPHAVLFWIVLLSKIAKGQEELTNPDDPYELRAYLLDPVRYRKGTSPFRAGVEGTASSATTIQTQVYVNQFVEFSQLHQEFTIVGYLRFFWTDPRLNYTSGEVTSLDLTGSIDKLWLPDWYIDNGRKAPETSKYLLALSPDGRITWSIFITATMSCPMEFQDLPWDAQKCPAVISSYSQSASDVVFSFAKDANGQDAPILYSGKTELSEWVVAIGESNTDLLEYLGGIQWSTLTMRIHLQRSHVFYWTEFLQPSLLFCAVSYFSFYIDVAQAPARATVVLLPVLIVVSKISASQTKMPAIQHPTWLQRWLTGILGFQCVAMLHFVFVLTLKRFCVKHRDQKLRHMQWLKHKESRCAVEASVVPVFTALSETPSHQGSESGLRKRSTRNFNRIHPANLELSPPRWARENFPEDRWRPGMEDFASISGGCTECALTEDKLSDALNMSGQSYLSEDQFNFVASVGSKTGGKEAHFSLETFLWLDLVLSPDGWSALRGERSFVARCRLVVMWIRFWVAIADISKVADVLMRIFFPLAVFLFCVGMLLNKHPSFTAKG